MPISEYDCGMARAATTADAFNAVAEPRRREILDALADGERPVNDLVTLLANAHKDYRVGPDLLASLPVGGFDGTLSRRWHGKPAQVLPRRQNLSGILTWSSAAKGLAAEFEKLLAVEA